MEDNSKKIRKPGQSFELTDRELLKTPVKLLDSAQRKRRRILRKKLREEKAENAHRKRRRPPEELVEGLNGYCAGYNRWGQPCRAYAVSGAKHCMAHLDDADQAKLGMKKLSDQGTDARIRQSAGREKVNPMASMREVVEVAQEKIIKRQFAPLGLEFVGYDEDGHPVIYDHGQEAGLVLHGVSKEGDVVVSRHADLSGQFHIAEKLWDRIYGKPRQTTVIEGGIKPVQVQPVHDPDRAKRVAKMLHDVGAIPRDHGGRKRAQPSEPAQDPGGDVVPLHKEES